MAGHPRETIPARLGAPSAISRFPAALQRPDGLKPWLCHYIRCLARGDVQAHQVFRDGRAAGHC